jgi:predicted outer membrane protein
MRAWAPFTAALLLVAACATQQTEEPAAETPAEEMAEASKAEPPVRAKPAAKPERTPAGRLAELEMLFSDFERLRRLPSAELAREQEVARQAFNQSRSELARVRYAMALAVPGSPPGEELRALELLDPVVKNPSAALHGIAFLMVAYVQEQRRLFAHVQGLQQNNQGLQQNVQALQQNVQGLQQKLDALRTLERSLTERREPVPKRK